MTFPMRNIYYDTGGRAPYIPDQVTTTPTNEPYLDWIEFILRQENIPQTVSTSYGDDEQTVPPDYAKSVCNLFAQLGAMGTSALFASGDNGVSTMNGSCLSNDGSNRQQFIPAFPASCALISSLFRNKCMRFT
jgi:tripeptidyl-peptidase-1